MSKEILRIQSPQRIYRTDSLVFSITTDKQYPPVEFNYDHQDTNLLLDSNEERISKEIINLNSKLSLLEGKVKSINSSKQQEPQNNNNLNISEVQPFKAGRICRKKSVKNSFISRASTNRKNHSLVNRTQLSYSSQKTQMDGRDRQFNKMKREMFKLKMSAEKSQRSKLKFSEELSESKRSYRRLKKKDQEHEKVIRNLRKQLEKSENIRKKQKEIIGSQKQEIGELRKIIKGYKICNMR